MIKRLFHSLLILSIVLILSQTILKNIALWGIIPDIGLIFLVFFSSTHGAQESQFSGFGFGLLEDVVSLSPMGFHALHRTICAYVFGLGKGNIFYDPIFIPTLMILLGTLLKYILYFVFSLVFNLGLTFELVFNFGFIIELLYNGVLAAALYFLYANLLNKKEVEKGAYLG